MGIRRRLLALCLAGMAALLAAVALGLWLASRRIPIPFDVLMTIGAPIFLAVVAGMALLWVALETELARPLSAFAGVMRSGQSGVQAHKTLAPYAAPFGDLVPATLDLMTRLHDVENARAVAVAHETAQIRSENARLAALLGDVPFGMILCSAQHKVAFYTAQAVRMLGGLTLGRSIFDLLDAPMLMQQNPVTDFICTAKHDGAQYRARLRMLMGDGQRGYALTLHDMAAVLPSPYAIARPLVYDFALLEAPATQGALRDLRYVAFDCETTGLHPEKGDELVQIAAVPLIGGRLVLGEEMEHFVNPARAIPLAAQAVHGISDEMVRNAPPPHHAIAALYDFAAGAVLIAHNAPFDMAFLRRHQGAHRFDQAILDTVLISAVIYGPHISHTLDALCARLGVEVPPAERHTALGDARAAAAAFSAMLPALEARGILTLDQLLAQTRKFGRLLPDLNA